MTVATDRSPRSIIDDPGALPRVVRRPRLKILHGRPGQLLSLGVAIATLVISVSVAASSSLALFTDSNGTGAILGTKAIFPGERLTPAFSVADSSAGGAPVDRSSELAFSNDGLTLTSSPWSSAFSSGRHLDFDLNASLPGGLAASGVTFELRFASAGAGATSCYYLEIRLISTNALLDTYGSSGSPLDCVTGTSLTLSTDSIAPTVATTDVLNDLRVRVVGADSGSNGMVIDRATVSGSTAFAPFTLYPVRYTDAADGTPSTSVWELAGP
jgi:hypothetical protein